MTRLLHALRCALALGAVAGGVACAHHGLTPAVPSVVPAAFVVRLHRVQKAGDRGILSSAVTTRRTTITEEGETIVKREEERRDVDLKAALKVIRVDETGEPLDLELAVESLIVQTPAGRREVLSAGRVVRVARGGEKVTYAASEPLSQEAERALDDIVSPHASSVTDDDIFGTREPQPIGGIWPVNAALAAKELGGLHLQIPPDGVQGQTRLVGLAEAAGQTCLDIAGELFISDARRGDPDGGAAGAPDGGAEAPGVPSETYELRVTHRRLVPVDTTLPELDATVTLHLDLVVTTPLGRGREKRTTVTYHDEKRRRFTPLR